MDILTINGTFAGTDTSGTMEWECPFTGSLMSISAEFLWECHGYFVIMVTQNDKPLYIVKASKSS
jgi:hypothetical protein